MCSLDFYLVKQLCFCIKDNINDHFHLKSANMLLLIHCYLDFYPESVFECSTCQRAGAITVWAPIFSQRPWPSLGLSLSTHLPSNSLLSLAHHSEMLLCVFNPPPPFFLSTGPPILFNASPKPNTLIHTHRHTIAPSITLIALVPIPSPLSSAAGKAN